MVEAYMEVGDEFQDRCPPFFSFLTCRESPNAPDACECAFGLLPQNKNQRGCGFLKRLPLPPFQATPPQYHNKVILRVCVCGCYTYYELRFVK